jgi:hypothetical protein
MAGILRDARLKNVTEKEVGAPVQLNSTEEYFTFMNEIAPPVAAGIAEAEAAGGGARARGGGAAAGDCDGRHSARHLQLADRRPAGSRCGCGDRSEEAQSDEGKKR